MSFIFIARRSHGETTARSPKKKRKTGLVAAVVNTPRFLLAHLSRAIAKYRDHVQTSPSPTCGRVAGNNGTALGGAKGVAQLNPRDIGR